MSVTIVAVIGVGSGVAQTAPAQKQAKDQGEVDLYKESSPQTNPDPAKRLHALDTWKEKYPDTAFKLERALFYAVTYQALNQPVKMFEAAKEVLSIDPKEINALGWVTALAESVPPTEDNLAAGEKAAHGLLGAEQPAGVQPAQWEQMKNAYEALAHKTLGYIATVRKQLDVAEQEYTKSLQTNPAQAAVSYSLGSVILGLKKPERYSDALFQLARAASLTGPGALPAPAQKTVDAFLVKSYAAYHGQDDAGLKELRQLATGPKAIAPEGFKIKDKNEIDAEKAAEFAKNNPLLALWKSIKDGLMAPNGDQYWESTLKGSAVPQLRGRIVSMKPAVRPKELVLAIEGEAGEVTLKLDAALAGKADPGTEIRFEGIPSAFTKDPFMVTFDVEKDKIEGWPAQAAPTPARRPATKKGAAKK